MSSSAERGEYEARLADASEWMRAKGRHYQAKWGRQLSGAVVAVQSRWQGVQIGEDCRFYGVPRIVRVGDSRIQIGDRCTFRSARWAARSSLERRVLLRTVGDGAALIIGDDSGFTGTTVLAAKEVVIGNGVMCGLYSVITDTDWHGVHPSERHEPGRSKPIHIEDNVFIGMYAIVLKGVTIGRDSLIGAGSVVTRDVPPGVIVAGNPAQVVREFD